MHTAPAQAKTAENTAIITRKKAPVQTMNLALYEPDIPQNTGTILRLAACLDLAVHIVGPPGFALTDRAFRRAGLDYADKARLVRHADFTAFTAARPPGRLVLATTLADLDHLEFAFQATDCVMMGSESAGVPDGVHGAVDARVKVPMVAGMRSLNVAVATAIILGEALRQTGGFPNQAA